MDPWIKWNFSKALSVGWMSVFPDEEEILLFGNFNQLIISSIYVIDDMGNYDHNKD